jgi:hypothetical protein
MNEKEKGVKVSILILLLKRLRRKLQVKLENQRP